MGRKSCAPTELILQGEYSEPEHALQKGRELAEAKGRLLVFKVRQGDHDGEVLTLNDVPLQFGSRKKYRDRRVSVMREF